MGQLIGIPLTKNPLDQHGDNTSISLKNALIGDRNECG